MADDNQVIKICIENQEVCKLVAAGLLVFGKYEIMIVSIGSPPSGLLLPHRQSPRGILDDNRRINAQLFEDTFYTRKGKDPDTVPEAKESEKADSSDMETLARLPGDLKTADLLKQLLVDKSSSGLGGKKTVFRLS